MIVVIHQAPCITQPVELVDHLFQYLQECLPVLVIFKNILTPITAGGDVIKGVGELYADWAGHEREYSRESATLLDLTPMVLR